MAVISSGVSIFLNAGIPTSAIPFSIMSLSTFLAERARQFCLYDVSPSAALFGVSSGVSVGEGLGVVVGVFGVVDVSAGVVSVGVVAGADAEGCRIM